MTKYLSFRVHITILEIHRVPKSNCLQIMPRVTHVICNLKFPYDDFDAPNLFLHWKYFPTCCFLISNRVQISNYTFLSKRPVHGLLSRFYPDFIQILSRFYPDVILILSWFYPDFLKIHFIQILSRFYPNFWKYLDKIRIKSR